MKKIILLAIVTMLLTGCNSATMRGIASGLSQSVNQSGMSAYERQSLEEQRRQTRAMEKANWDRRMDYLRSLAR